MGKTRSPGVKQNAGVKVRASLTLGLFSQQFLSSHVLSSSSLTYELTLFTTQGTGMTLKCFGKDCFQDFNCLTPNDTEFKGYLHIREMVHKTFHFSQEKQLNRTQPPPPTPSSQPSPSSNPIMDDKHPTFHELIKPYTCMSCIRYKIRKSPNFYEEKETDPITTIFYWFFDHFSLHQSQTLPTSYLPLGIYF